MSEKFAPCEDCGGVKAPVLEIGVGGYRKEISMRLCPNCQAVRDEAARQEQERRAAAARAYRAAHLAELLGRANVPERYRSCSLDNFRGRPPEMRPAFITGPPGVGKTHLAVGYLREELLQRGEDAGRFVRCVDFFKEMRATFGDSRGPQIQENEQEVLDRYGRQVALLILDDLGTEKSSDWVQQSLYDLIDSRYARLLPTVITSNLSLDQIAVHYPNHGDRLASRIAGLGEELEIKGRDRRLER